MTSENLRIDLHSHTRASDGKLTPQELVMRASNRQIDVLAITDHDTTAGLAAAEQAIVEQNSRTRLITGVEISCKWHSFDIHVVGLAFDQSHQGLQDFLSEQQRRRDARAEAICKKLEKNGLEGAYEGSKALAKGSFSRSHMARWLVSKGHVASMDAAFKRYLAKGGKAYVANQWHSIAEAVAIIHAAGGVAVLAHPSRYSMSTKWLRKLLVEFSEAGGDGMEVVLSQQGSTERDLLLSLASQYQLYCSLGSDFHHESQWVDLGKNLYRPDGCRWIWQSPRWQEEL
ncbi:RNase RNM [Paraferrimonas sedimenticola]|uniref:Phosphatase n=1 Tax=Paraferrimonas sedimenticola TaxID=375674 RepID=A0AA37RRW5_9GAMM|nr:PHP domain-containing protein [Paraferrimonas sedimenticola]GLP94923.1 phosphatase [Paraferrimonas sedimenticola]